jgi:serine phosphatase RsbU (regulator of sigma subunit)
LGCVYIELRSLAQPWYRKALNALFPAAQSLAAQVASALHQARIYSESLEFQATLQELEFAGRIQASFLPNELPDLIGWELAVTLVPARETSGDYFDFIPLPDGRVGILVADVADKGLGAALYMALSRTLFRTYALEYEARPDIVFFSANERILQDARANLFVTAFYGILDPRQGTLTYSNAGHNPPILINNQEGATFTALTPTGIPIGVDPDAIWTQEVIQIDPGAALILYTDGIPDAQNSDGSFYKERRLMEVALASINHPAQEIQAAILTSVQEFVGKASQFDDITLLVLVRDILVKEDEGDVIEEIAESETEEFAVPELGTPSDRTGARSRWNSLGVGSGLRTPKRWSTRL